MHPLLSQFTRFTSSAEIWHVNPFCLKVGEILWLVATDNQILLAIRSMEKLPGVTLSKKHPKELKRILSTAAVNPIEISLADLKKWGGEIPTMIIPSGDVDQQHQGVLLGHLVDRRKLAYLFSKFTVPIIRVWVVRAGVLGFESKGNWRAFIAGLDGSPDGSELEFRTQPLSALELVESIESTTK